MVILNELSTKIQLRRADQSTYDSHPNFSPLKGEVCFVDRPDGELKIKVGDGISSFQQLDWAMANIITGYYYEDDFYYDEEHTAKAGTYTNTLYIELSRNILFFYDGEHYINISSVVGDATPTEKGIMKLYPSTGSNVDGTITQLGITTGLNDLKFSVDGEVLKANY